MFHHAILLSLLAAEFHANPRTVIRRYRTAQQTAAMEPMIGAGAVVVLDRHYRSLAPYRAQQKMVFAVRAGAGLVLRFVEFDDGRLILRPLSGAFPVQLLALGKEETPGDYLVGRVCLVVAEI